MEETVTGLSAEWAVHLVDLLTLGTFIAMGLRALIPLLAKVAAKTATKVDDDALSTGSKGIEWLISALDWTRRFVPRVVVGPLPSNQAIARSIPPPPRTPTIPYGSETFDLAPGEGIRGENGDVFVNDSAGPVQLRREDARALPPITPISVPPVRGTGENP